MKILKNDTRYIIKKIIIGVGIALILAFLKTNNVFADTINVSPNNIAHNYCFNPDNDSTYYEVITCPDSVLNNNSFTASLFTLGIKSTIVGQDIFTFSYENTSSSNPHLGYSFGFENLQNGDMFFINSWNYKNDISSYNRFGVGDKYQMSFIYNSQNIHSSIRTSYINIYITDDYSRALDLYNSNKASSNNSYKHLSHVDDYYFVSFIASSNFNFNDYFNYFGSPWVMNQLNASSEYSSYERNLYVLELDNNYLPISVIDDLTLDDTSNNLQITNQDYWQQGFDSGGDDWAVNSCTSGGMCSKNIDSYLDFFRLPFDFIKSLSRNNCTPLNIPLPFVNGSIQLPCLSSKFHQVLGDNFYNIIFYIISGVYAYRITILNIDTITDTLNPSDDKLEVVDL